MTEKKTPAFGALGNPYGTSVPDDVMNFFGTDAPAEQPAVRWTEEQEKAAAEMKRQAEELNRQAEELERQAEETRRAELVAREAEAVRQAELARSTQPEEPRRKRGQAEIQPVEAIASQGATEATATRGAEPKTLGQTIRSHWDSLIDSLGIGGKSKAERNRARDEAETRPAGKSGESIPATVNPSAERSAVEKSAQGRVAKAAPQPEQRSVPAPEEIPADAFGFGLFSNPPKTPAPNPLDSLFETPVVEKTPEVTDSRRRRGRSVPPPVVEVEPEVSENEVEFEVVDLAGEDISDLWEGEPRVSERVRDRPIPKEIPPRSRRPDAEPVQDRQRPASRRPSREEVEFEPAEPLPKSDTRRDSAGVSRREPRSEVRREPKADVRRESKVEEPVEVRREVRRPEIDDEPQEERRPRRRPAASRPAPTPPPQDDDDDGYTVDNSWVPNDPRDVDAPKRRPVPTWRRVVDHIVDRNLANRRGGGGGGRGRGAGPPRGNKPVGIERGELAAPRPKRENAPTYLDVPVDDFDDPFEDTLAEDLHGDETPPRGGRRREAAGDWRPSRGRTPESFDEPSRSRAEETPRGTRRPRANDEYGDPESGPAPVPREPGRREPGRREPGRREPGRREPGRREPGRREPGPTESGRREPGRGSVGREPMEREPIGREPVGREPLGREPDEPRGRSRRPPADDDFDGPTTGRGRRRY
jgi:hypothetical protein